MFILLSESFLLISFFFFFFFFFFFKIMVEFEMMSSYECGFDPCSFTRLVFSYRFFLISILFIIFDVEISLMLPVPFLMISLLGFIIFIIFIFILLLGLLYEYYYGSLEWLDYYNK